MMEWGDIGIKDADDVRRCLAEGATVDELERLFGERIRPLLAEAQTPVPAYRWVPRAPETYEVIATHPGYLITGCFIDDPAKEGIDQ